MEIDIRRIDDLEAVPGELALRKVGISADMLSQKRNRLIFVDERSEPHAKLSWDWFVGGPCSHVIADDLDQIVDVSATPDDLTLAIDGDMKT